MRYQDFRRKVEAARDGNTVRLRLVRSRAARSVVFDEQAPAVDRLLAAAASDFTTAERVEAALSSTPELKQEVIDLANAQAGNVTIGAAAGRDVITINVYVGAEGRYVE